LRADLGSRSFTVMRVEVVEKVARRAAGAGCAGADAGEAAPSLAIKNFLAAIESDVSLFCIAQPLTGPLAEESATGKFYSADMVLEFRKEELSRQRSLHFALLEKLVELLKEAGSKESLEAKLCLTTASISIGRAGSAEKTNEKELALWIRLAARGDSEEQAMLRWGLGIAHIQQALLFTSRHLRQQLSQPDE